MSLLLCRGYNVPTPCVEATMSLPLVVEATMSLPLL